MKEHQLFSSYLFRHGDIDAPSFLTLRFKQLIYDRLLHIHYRPQRTFYNDHDHVSNIRRHIFHKFQHSF